MCSKTFQGIGYDQILPSTTSNPSIFSSSHFMNWNPPPQDLIKIDFDESKSNQAATVGYSIRIQREIPYGRCQKFRRGLLFLLHNLLHDKMELCHPYVKDSKTLCHGKSLLLFRILYIFSTNLQKSTFIIFMEKAIWQQIGWLSQVSYFHCILLFPIIILLQRSSIFFQSMIR